MIDQKELRECFDAVKRIETLLSSVEQRLTEIAKDVHDDLEAMRERNFWDDYQRYVEHPDG